MDGCMDVWMDRQSGHPNTIRSIEDAHCAGADLWRCLRGQMCKVGKGRPMGRARTLFGNKSQV